MGKGGSNAPSDRPVRDVLPIPEDFERGHAAEIDRADLMRQDQAVLRLAGVALGDQHLARIPRIPGGDGTDRRRSREVRAPR